MHRHQNEPPADDVAMSAPPPVPRVILTRRRFLLRAAAALGSVAVTCSAGPAFAVSPLQVRGACACGGALGVARAVRSTQGVTPSRARPAARVFENRVGWAYNARWQRSFADPTRKSADEVLADMRRMRDLGCNTVYIGHNSAGNADPNAFEPGLAPADWYAIAAATPSAPDARKVVDAIATTLEAAAKAGLDVVLGIGYQIMMGDEWNASHRSDLRVNRYGDLLMHWDSVYTASPYAPAYRRDIQEYYGWVNETFVKPYPHVLALNLADEPMGSDLSPHAMREFLARYGVPFELATNVQRGDFLTGVIPDYAGWSANTWKALNPDVNTMMTFHIQRDEPFLPDVERIFAQTPDTFIFSADTHLDDGPIERTITPENTRLLYGMCRSLGWLSRVYQKPLMLWTAANAWGLKKNGGLREAMLNLDIVHDATKQAGGQIGMLMAWGWNIYLQGVYDDAGNFRADKETMLTGVSQALAQRRERLSLPSDSKPERVYYKPAAVIDEVVGANRFDHLTEGIEDLSPIPFDTQNAVYLTDGRALEEARRLGIPVTTL